MRQPVITSTSDTRKTLLDGNRQVKLDASATDGDVYLVEGIMPEGSAVPLHIHEHEDEIFHVLEGQVKVVLGDQTIDGQPGDIVYLPRGIRHSIRTVGATTARVLNYVIPGRNFEAFFDALHQLPPADRSAQRAQLAQAHGITFLEA